MRSKEIAPNLCALVKSYLTDRTVTFEEGGVKSDKLCTMECPQGSVLGPTLWNLLLGDFLDNILPLNTIVIAYADDIVFVVASNSRADVRRTAQTFLDLLSSWATGDKRRFR